MGLKEDQREAYIEFVETRFIDGVLMMAGGLRAELMLGGLSDHDIHLTLCRCVKQLTERLGIVITVHR